MKLKRRFEILLVFIFFVFSWWFFSKSFSYDGTGALFHIARNEVGDFGLHLGLIRSFSRGNNFPVESPFFPGQSLPYHYYFDLAAGLLEKSGLRINLAVNGLSALAFTVLLYLIYKLPQLIFGMNRILGITTVLLFIFPANASFIDFFASQKISSSLIRQIWTMPDLITRGPFDGKLPSIYFTQAVFLNQRHLVVGLAIGLGITYFILKKILLNRKIPDALLVILGLILGISSRIHSLIAAGTILIVVSLLIMFKKLHWILPLFLPAVMTVLMIYKDALLGINLVSQNYFHQGFLTPEPFSISNFLNYWGANLGLGIVLIPLGFFMSNNRQRKVFGAFFVLFIIANIFQLSFRIEHNHSLINYFLVIADCYLAFALLKIANKGFKGTVLSGLLALFLTVSGVLNLMGVKNDFQYPVPDAPKDKFMQWIISHTDKGAIFLSRQNLYDPVVLAGRRSYFGDTYYLQVMGYDFSKRQVLTKEFYEAADLRTLDAIRKERIDYMVISLKPVNDFFYTINRNFLKDNLKLVYQDADVQVFKL